MNQREDKVKELNQRLKKATNLGDILALINEGTEAQGLAPEYRTIELSSKRSARTKQRSLYAFTGVTTDDPSETVVTYLYNDGLSQGKSKVASLYKVASFK